MHDCIIEFREEFILEVKANMPDNIRNELLSSGLNLIGEEIFEADSLTSFPLSKKYNSWSIGEIQYMLTVEDITIEYELLNNKFDLTIPKEKVKSTKLIFKI